MANDPPEEVQRWVAKRRAALVVTELPTLPRRECKSGFPSCGR
jgi:hypothetical protein